MARGPVRRGKMQLVGAGPGDPELLTLKAYRALQEADLVLTDRLVPKDILALAKGEVRVARKRCGRADLAQAELDAWGLEALREGKHVVRLKNGDPFMFGRGGEEAVIYSEAGFDVEVVPGISSSLSAPMSAGIPATMRDVADQVLVCTGHGKQDRFPNLPEYCVHRTTIFLMAIGRLEGLCNSLQQDKGYPSDLPAAIIHAATMVEAKTIRSTLGEIAEEVRRQGINPPGTLVLGNVVNALTYLKHYDAVKFTGATTSVQQNMPKYQISYAPLESVPELDPEVHQVYNASAVVKRNGTIGSWGSLWHVLLLLLPFAFSLFEYFSREPENRHARLDWRKVNGAAKRYRQTQQLRTAMAPKGTMSRKEKRKSEREEKKRSRNKRQRRDEPQPQSPAQNPKRAGGATRDAGNSRKRPQTHNSSRIQNKFHELLQETTGLSMRRGKEALSREDLEIKALERNLGISSASGKETGINKLKKEYSKDGLGEDFFDFLTDLDKISKLVKGDKASAASNNEEGDGNEEEEEDGSEDENSDNDGAFGGSDDFEMDEETRREMELLQAEDADFLRGMDELPTDESDLDSDVDLAEFETDGDEEDEDVDDEVLANTLKNQQAAEIDDEEDEEQSGDDDDAEEEEEESDEDNEAGEEEQVNDADDNAEGSDGEEEEVKEDLVIAEDIYGRPVIKSADGSKPSAYIPPHLRRKMQEEAAKAAAAAAGGASTAVLPSKMDDQALRELTRRLNGQVNRISEANMESISLEVEKIYREYPRSVVNQILLDKILQTACHRGIVMTPMIKVCGALIAALYHSIGSEVGGFFIEKIVLKMVESVKESVADVANHEANEDEDGEASTSKEAINLLLFVAMLYNFGVVHCTLVYDLFRSFVTNFSSVEVELIHQLLKVSGHQLRSDDADALKDMVASVQQKVASLSQGNDKPQERVRFILDLIYDLKKPSKKKSRQGGGGAGGMEMDLSSLKKWLGRVKTRVGNANNPLRISLHELLHADQDGRWWIVGGTWVGYQKAKNGDDADDDTHSKERDEENRLVKLAEKQRMNTDVRKKIFVAIMGASDCLDAYERLLQLHLKEKQEREIVRVLLHCSGQEKKFNKYYLVLADKLCEMDPRYKFTFQLAFWDIFKQLDTFKPRKLYNLAQMLAGLIISKSLSLSCLKVLDFTDLPEKSILFMRVVLEKILKLEDELEMAQVFQRLLQTKKAQLTIDGLAVFVHQHLTGFRSEEDAAVRALLKKRSKSVKSLLDHLAKSAASSEAMEGFM